MKLSKELKDRFMKVDPAQIGHFIKSGYMSPKINPIYKQAKMIGPAFTIRIPVNDSAMVYYAMERAPKGSVIVIDRGGDDLYACVGEVVTTAAKYLGLEGIVVDGPATDSIGIEELQFPVFSKGLSAVTTTLIGMTGEYNVPVQCGGAVVNPGDIVFGDADGVIVIPFDECESLLEKAEKADVLEIEKLEAFKNGGCMSDFVNLNKLIETDTAALINELKKVD